MTCDVNRRPTALTYKAFLLISTSWTAFGLVPLPGSLRDDPGIFGQTAAMAIWVGCLISLIGLVWRGLRSTALYVEQFGLACMAVGCSMYAGALLAVHWAEAVPLFGWGNLPEFFGVWFRDISIAFGLSGGIAVASVVQSVTISRYRRHARRSDSDGQ